MESECRKLLLNAVFHQEPVEFSHKPRDLLQVPDLSIGHTCESDITAVQSWSDQVTLQQSDLEVIKRHYSSLVSK